MPPVAVDFLRWNHGSHRLWRSQTLGARLATNFIEHHAQRCGSSNRNSNLTSRVGDDHSVIKLPQHRDNENNKADQDRAISLRCLHGSLL
jgi:hypothetical protein